MGDKRFLLLFNLFCTGIGVLAQDLEFQYLYYKQTNLVKCISNSQIQ